MLRKIILRALLFSAPAALIAAETATNTTSANYDSLPTLYIATQETANLEPVATYETPISNLEFNPRVDLQSRNMAEAQGDVSIRGGIFENTGFRLGSATLVDPQTGHYFAELPIAPEMLSGPEVLTGSNNALYGFNSTVGTISYNWSQIQDGGSITAGAGDHDLNFQRIHSGWTLPIGDSADWSWGIEGEYSRSESSGTIDNGDHDFYRTSGRIQLLGPNSQTDLFAGYQEKFFGWPSMYAPFGTNETENLKTRLFLLNHTQDYGNSSHWEITNYFRRHGDHYIFSREKPTTYQAYHETDVSAFALSGTHVFNKEFALNYATQLTFDTIESSHLENNFTSRSYYKLSLLPEYRIDLGSDETLVLRAGATIDDTNRNDSELSGIADITWTRQDQYGNSNSIYLSYAETSQVPGYTAIGGSTDAKSALFVSNQELDRELTQNLEIGTRIARESWSFEAALFYRWDDELTDWTYTFGTNESYGRAANPVDIGTFGAEFIATKQWGDFEAIASYTYLQKNEDYGNDTIDASFYALNYSNHRATLGAIWRPADWLEARIDNEWRSQEENALRSNGDDAFFTHLGLSIFPANLKNLEIFFAIDNLWDVAFQDVPGTPGRGDQYSAGVSYRW